MQHITFLAIGILFTAQCTLGIPKWHTDSAGRQYYIDEEPKYNWFEAENLCARENLQLVIVDSEAKNNALINLLKTDFDGQHYNLWLGANDEFSKEESVNRTFYWTATGQPLNFTYWESGNPSNFLQEEHCAHISKIYKNYKWNDNECIMKYGFICEPSRSCEKSKEISNPIIDAIQKALQESMQQHRNESTDKINEVLKKTTEDVLEMIREKNKSILKLIENSSAKNIDANCSKYLNENDKEADQLFVCNFAHRSTSDVNSKIAEIQKEILESILDIQTGSKVEVNMLIALEEADNEKLHSVMQFVLGYRNDNDEIIEAFKELVDSDINNLNKDCLSESVIELFDKIIANKTGNPILNADYNFTLPNVSDDDFFKLIFGDTPDNEHAKDNSKDDENVTDIYDILADNIR